MKFDAMAQPHASLRKADWGALSGNVYTLPCVCKGAEYDHSQTPGTIEVHLVGNKPDKWYVTYLNATERKGMMFDKIRTTGTTVDLDYISVFPASGEDW